METPLTMKHHFTEVIEFLSGENVTWWVMRRRKKPKGTVLCNII